MAPGGSSHGSFCSHTSICRRSSAASVRAEKGSRAGIEPLRRLNPGQARRRRGNDLTSGDGGEFCWRRETDSAAILCAAQLSTSTGRRLVPPLTAVPSRIGEEPWRERPWIVRRAAVPRPFEGSFTPRFPVSLLMLAATNIERLSCGGRTYRRFDKCLSFGSGSHGSMPRRAERTRGKH